MVFKHPPHTIFPQVDALRGNALIIRLQPDEGIMLRVAIKDPGPGGMRLVEVPLDMTFARTLGPDGEMPEAYERLIMDVIRGNQTLFMRGDEVEAAWEWTDPIIAAWEESGLAAAALRPGQRRADRRLQADRRRRASLARDRRMIEVARQAYPDRDTLMRDLAELVADQLRGAHASKGRATLAVPGGTTPGPFLAALSEADLAWADVRVLPTDERMVSELSSRSNARLIRETLLQGPAAAAQLRRHVRAAPRGAAGAGGGGAADRRAGARAWAPTCTPPRSFPARRSSPRRWRRTRRSSSRSIRRGSPRRG